MATSIDHCIKTIETASRGEDVRDAIISALRIMVGSNTIASNVDSVLSAFSTNPVQNKVITKKLEILEQKILNPQQTIDLDDLIEAYSLIGRHYGNIEGAEIFNDYENNEAEGTYSHAEGENTSAAKEAAHAEGKGTNASGIASHAEGMYNESAGDYSHAEGSYTNANGLHSHAEGLQTVAEGKSSHAEGNNSTASGDNSHAEGLGTIAAGENQHVGGKYNVSDPDYAEIIGGGSTDEDRKNIRTLDWSGNATYAGKVTAGGSASGDNDLVPLSQVRTLIANAIASIDISTYANVDSAFDATSVNPIANGVLTLKITELENACNSLVIDESLDEASPHPISNRAVAAKIRQIEENIESLGFVNADSTHY